MKHFPRSQYGLLALLAACAVAAPVAHAQVCRGTPRRGGVAYENGRMTAGGTGQGVSAVVTPGSRAIGLNFHTLNSPPGESGYGAALRFSLVFGNKFQICPGIGLGIDQQSWNANTGTLKTYILSGRGGVGAGYDFTFADDFSVAPFLVAEYAERVSVYDLKIQSSKSNTTGNTGGRAEAEYGAIVRYKRVYVGYSANHTFDAGAALAAHWLIGFSF